MASHIKKTKKIILLSFLLFILFLSAAVMTPLLLGPEFLIAEDSLESSKEYDAIIVLSGNEERLEHATELFNEGWASHIILTNSTENGTTPEEAMSMGVPQDAIFEEPSATSTYENATLSKNIIEEEGFSSALVVTSDYHSRRTKMTFDDIYDNEIELDYSFASSFFDPSDGMTEHEKRMTFGEYVKIGVYWFRLLLE
ncbi:YdcF family protein [Halobacillus trueperi]|uniref:YdcF family protein n=1 Tax=Halobacillus trueperi TaxID=156205 RepID=A0A3E0JBD1_9BACI|nr:YdcF family protein [Halobacillus trueperi]REJ10212.1 YdcF family protein [Halobacillus trueperi]